jgi:hypothetical protein
MRSGLSKKARHAQSTDGWVKQDFLENRALIVIPRMHIGPVFQEDLH